MKILFANDSIDLLHGGGTAKRTLSVAKQLAKENFHVSVISLSETINKPFFCNKDGLATYFLPVWNRRFLLPRISIGALFKIVSKNDALYLSGHWSVLNIILAAHARTLNIPYIICPAGSLQAWGRSSLLKHTFNLLCGNRYVRLASGYVAVTREEISDFIPYGVEANAVQVIPNAFEPSQSKNTQDLSKKFGIRKPFFLYLGRLHLIKGPDILLSAFIQVSKKIPFDLVFAGPDGGLMVSLRNQVKKKGLNARVHFVGFVESNEKDWLLSVCEALIIPSRKEAMSNVYLEAAAFKKPIIVSDKCGLNNVIRPESGIVVQDHTNQLAQSLLEITKRDRVKMGACLSADAQKLYEWSVLKHKYISLFKNMN